MAEHELTGRPHAIARRGPRRKVDSSARGDILRAAQRLFSRRSLSEISLRAIAQEAGVNPALTLYYFENKEELIMEALSASIRPLMTDVFRPGSLTLGVGRQAVLRFLEFWDTHERRQSYAAMVLSAGTDGRLAQALRSAIVSQIESQFSSLLPKGELRTRTALYTSQIIGLGYSRYVLGLEPIASMSAKTLSASVGPILDRYLMGPLPD
jgi:AcrR family transcriptional regulator